MPQCSICLVNIKNKNRAKLLCGHIFHTSCIIQWAKNANNCPTCRKYIINTFGAGHIAERLLNFYFENRFIIKRSNLRYRDCSRYEYIEQNKEEFLSNHLNSYLDLEQKDVNFDSIENNGDYFKIYTFDTINNILKFSRKRKTILSRKQSKTIRLPTIRYGTTASVFLMKSDNKIIPIIFYNDSFSSLRSFTLKFSIFFIPLLEIYFDGLPVSNVLGISRDRKFIYVQSVWKTIFKLSWDFLGLKFRFEESIEFINHYKE